MPSSAKTAALVVAALILPAATPAEHGKRAAPAAAHAAPHGASQTEAYPAPPAPPAQAHAGHWGYEGPSGPEKWGELSEEFKACKVGHMQSPVDLGGADIKGSFTVRTAYKAARKRN